MYTPISSLCAIDVALVGSEHKHCIPARRPFRTVFATDQADSFQGPHARAQELRVLMMLLFRWSTAPFNFISAFETEGGRTECYDCYIFAVHCGFYLGTLFPIFLIFAMFAAAQDHGVCEEVLGMVEVWRAFGHQRSGAEVVWYHARESHIILSGTLARTYCTLCL